MADKPILQVDHVSVTLDDVEILHDVSFQLNQGEAIAVIGPNGAGKTVLFRALLGLVPHMGTIVWKQGIKIGYVPQRFSVDRSAPITAMEFFLLQSRSFWQPPSPFVTHVEEELKLVGLDKPILKKNLGELSGGQTQRVLIAWALLTQPDVILLDEPTAGVDLGFEHSIYQLLRKVQTERRMALLLISHDLSVVYQNAQQVVCLNKSIVCQGRPVDTLNSAALSALYGESGVYLHDHAEGH